MKKAARVTYLHKFKWDADSVSVLTAFDPIITVIQHMEILVKIQVFCKILFSGIKTIHIAAYIASYILNERFSSALQIMDVQGIIIGLKTARDIDETRTSITGYKQNAIRNRVFQNLDEIWQKLQKLHSFRDQQKSVVTCT